jgi:hypothetical protein
VVFEPARQHAIPEKALIGGQVQALQVGAKPGESAAEVGWMVGQVGDQAASVAARKLVLGSRPVSPMVAQNSFLLLLCGAVELIWFHQGQAQSRFMIAVDQFAGHGLAPHAHGAKSLIIEVVCDPVPADFVERRQILRQCLLGKVAQHYLKTIGTDVSRIERPRRLS